MSFMANEQRTIKVGGCGWKEGNMKFKHKLRLMVGKYQSIKPISQQMGKIIQTMERLYMEAQDGLKTIAPPLFLNIFFYFLLV